MRETKIKKDRGNSWVIVIMLIALLAAFLVNNYIILPAKIVGESMVPLLKENDWIITNRLAYCQEAPKQNDIILFKKQDLENEIIVKRIIALPFDTVEIKNGQVLVNGELFIDEDIPINTENLAEQVLDINETETMKRITVPQNCYFVMGDNRLNSIDSRYWESPFVMEKEIIGKVVLKYYKGIEVIN